MIPEFNLLYEPWIRVLTQDGRAEEVSLSEALLQAHTYQDLSGELPSQDIVILRQLLALLYRVFSEKDADGEQRPIDSKRAAFDRWSGLRRLGHFPAEPLKAYFETWKDRFWLFHEDRPFGQVLQARIGTQYTSAKLNGELSESSNKDRLFPVRTGVGKARVSYPEAARWLLYVNAFDDTSAKPKGKDLPSVGAGWLGKIGMISAVGENLFETLMLNLTLLQDGEELWEPGVPAWELEHPRSAERTQIAIPRNPAALYTLQSRRLLLEREGDCVTGFALLGGDFFERSGAFAEQMTVWRRDKGKKGEPDTFQPRRHDPSRQMWRDLAAIISQEKDSAHGRIPGVVRWIAALRMAGRLDGESSIRFRTSAVQYGDKDFFVTDVFGDTLAFHADLLTEKGAECRTLALQEIRRCERIAYYTGVFARELAIAGGDDTVDQEPAERAKTELYYRLDEPFRRWLEALDPDDPDEQEEQQERWHEESERIAIGYGRTLVNDAGKKAYVGRRVTVKEKNRETSRYYSSPELFNGYQYRIRHKVNEMEG